MSIYISNKKDGRSRLRYPWLRLLLCASAAWGAGMAAAQESGARRLFWRAASR